MQPSHHLALECGPPLGGNCDPVSPPPQPKAAPTSLSVSIDLPALSSSWKWNHTTCSLCCSQSMQTADPAPAASMAVLIVSRWSLPARDHFLGEAHVSGAGLTDFISWNPQIVSFLFTIVPIFQMRRLSLERLCRSPRAMLSVAEGAFAPGYPGPCAFYPPVGRGQGHGYTSPCAHGSFYNPQLSAQRVNGAAAPGGGLVGGG